MTEPILWAVLLVYTGVVVIVTCWARDAYHAWQRRRFGLTRYEYDTAELRRRNFDDRRRA